MLKTWLLILLIVLILLVILFFIIGNYFYSFALSPYPGTQAFDDQEYLAAETITIQSHDGLRLSGYLARTDGHRYAIAVHGYHGDARSMAPLGRAYYDRGFSVLLPDLRAHGASEGDAIGMGWLDRLDMLRWIDYLIALDAEAEILLYGVSMGGATVMMTAGEPLPPQVKLVIEDCGYTSVWEEFSVQLRAMFGLPPFPVMQAATVVSRIRAGYWLGDADALAQVAKATLPMLFIHGEEDTFVPFAMLQPLYDAKANGEREMLIIPGAEHGQASATDPDQYWAAIDAFIDRHMPARENSSDSTE